MTKFIGFPDQVNETSARVVAGGVVSMAATAIVLDQPWLLGPLTYGFAARVLTGPRLSPLGQLATRVITPRLRRDHRIVAGAPKRLAQGMGLALSGTASVLALAGHKRVAYGVLGTLAGAAALEAFAGYCLACKLYPSLVRAGLAQPEGCEECADLSLRAAA